MLVTLELDVFLPGQMECSATFSDGLILTNQCFLFNYNQCTQVSSAIRRHRNASKSKKAERREAQKSAKRIFKIQGSY